MNNQRNKIVIADDEKDVLELHKNSLLKKFPNCEIEECENATELQSILNQNSNEIYFVITDNAMPTPGDGLGIIQKYSKNSEYPFILCSTNQRIGEEAKKYRAYFIKKPVDYNKFGDEISKVIDEFYKK